MVICLERGADLHIAQLMPLPLTVCCFSQIQIGFTVLVPADPGSPGKRAVKCVCVHMLVNVIVTCKYGLIAFAFCSIVYNNTRLTALFWDYPGEPVPER